MCNVVEYSISTNSYLYGLPLFYSIFGSCSQLPSLVILFQKKYYKKRQNYIFRTRDTFIRKTIMYLSVIFKSHEIT